MKPWDGMMEWPLIGAHPQCRIEEISFAIRVEKLGGQGDKFRLTG